MSEKQPLDPLKLSYWREKEKVWENDRERLRETNSTLLRAAARAHTKLTPMTGPHYVPTREAVEVVATGLFAAIIEVAEPGAVEKLMADAAKDE